MCSQDFLYQPCIPTAIWSHSLSVGLPISVWSTATATPRQRTTRHWELSPAHASLTTTRLIDSERWPVTWSKISDGNTLVEGPLLYSPPWSCGHDRSAKASIRRAGPSRWQRTAIRGLPHPPSASSVPCFLPRAINSIKSSARPRKDWSSCGGSDFLTTEFRRRSRSSGRCAEGPRSSVPSTTVILQSARSSSERRVSLPALFWKASTGSENSRHASSPAITCQRLRQRMRWRHGTQGPRLCPSFYCKKENISSIPRYLAPDAASPWIPTRMPSTEKRLGTTSNSFGPGRRFVRKTSKIVQRSSTRSSHASTNARLMPWTFTSAPSRQHGQTA